MVAIKNLTMVLVGLAGLTTAMESETHLDKRIKCTSDNCRVPSTFGSKHKVAGTLRARYEDVYERDDIDAILERRFKGVSLGVPTASSPKSWRRDEGKVSLGKRFKCTSSHCKLPSNGNKIIKKRYQPEASLDKRFTCTSTHCKIPSNGNKIIKKSYEPEVSLGKRFSCTSTHCKLPSNGNKIIKKRYQPEGSLDKRFTCNSSHCKLPSNGNKIIKKRYEPEVSLGKRIACPSGNCRIPSTFGKKHKLAGAVAKRYEDSI
ncbi:unnamed protein product [Clonostachys byssicola]|uniref:Uncharacterized protein n=1 Tax=Clonostachys byssicola TaxID=160290 RepID=A0A9N9URV6_9HYPO|nr:unnamed protein product [Clonostachys byssicola]